MAWFPLFNSNISQDSNGAQGSPEANSGNKEHRAKEHHVLDIGLLNARDSSALSVYKPEGSESPSTASFLSLPTMFGVKKVDGETNKSEADKKYISIPIVNKKVITLDDNDEEGFSHVQYRSLSYAEVLSVSLTEPDSAALNSINPSLLQQAPKVPKLSDHLASSSYESSTYEEYSDDGSLLSPACSIISDSLDNTDVCEECLERSTRTSNQVSAAVLSEFEVGHLVDDVIASHKKWTESRRVHKKNETKAKVKGTAAGYKYGKHYVV